MLKINKSILIVCLISLFLLVSQASAADANSLDISDIDSIDGNLIQDNYSLDSLDSNNNYQYSLESKKNYPDSSIDSKNSNFDLEKCSFSKDYSISEEKTLINQDQSSENIKNNDLDNNDETAEIIEEEIKDTEGVVMAGDNYSCGPASLATALNKLGLNLTLSEVSQYTNTTENGTNMQSLIDAAKHYNFSAFGVEIQAKDLKENSIVHLNMGYGEHWTVVSKVTEDNIFLADSTEGNINMSIAEFNSIYTGKAIILSSMNEDSGNLSVSNGKVLDSSQCLKISGKGMKRKVIGYRYVTKYVTVAVWKKVLKPKVIGGHVSFSCWEWTYSKVYVIKKKKVKEPIYKYYYVSDEALTSASIKKK